MQHTSGLCTNILQAANSSVEKSRDYDLDLEIHIFKVFAFVLAVFFLSKFFISSSILKRVNVDLDLCSLQTAKRNRQKAGRGICATRLLQRRHFSATQRCQKR